MEEKDVKITVGGQETANNHQQDMDINADSDVPGTAYLSNPVEDEAGELEKLQQEIAGWKDKYLRHVAEFDNFRKRTAKERIELSQTAGKEIITQLLDVLDDCDRAQQQMETNNEVSATKEGILLIFNKLRNVLQAKGLKEMESLHQEFNPDLHEAVTQLPAPTAALKDKVLDVIVKGYYLNDKILRFAKVVVGK
jgi:molecular chaperone GrpE